MWRWIQHCLWSMSPPSVKKPSLHLVAVIKRAVLDCSGYSTTSESTLLHLKQQLCERSGIDCMFWFEKQSNSNDWTLMAQSRSKVQVWATACKCCRRCRHSGFDLSTFLFHKTAAASDIFLHTHAHTVVWFVCFGKEVSYCWAIAVWGQPCTATQLGNASAMTLGNDTTAFTERMRPGGQNVNCISLTKGTFFCFLVS